MSIVLPPLRIFYLRSYPRFNEYMVVISIGMDILLLSVTWLKNPFVYCQFHPVVYIVKLHIEMTMARKQPLRYLPSCPF